MIWSKRKEKKKRMNIHFLTSYSTPGWIYDRQTLAFSFFFLSISLSGR